MWGDILHQTKGSDAAVYNEANKRQTSGAGDYNEMYYININHKDCITCDTKGKYKILK